jgi:hypothetical protein
MSVEKPGLNSKILHPIPDLGKTFPYIMTNVLTILQLISLDSVKQYFRIIRLLQKFVFFYIPVNKNYRLTWLF